MKKFFLIMIVSVLALSACSTSASNASGNSRRTPIAQIPVQATQPPATTQPQAADTATVSPATATPASVLATVTPSATTDASKPAGLNVLSSQGYAANNGFYIVGELLNNSSTPMGNIKITATYYYQRNGKPIVIGTMDASTLLNVVPANGQAPFVIGPFLLTSNKNGPVTWYDLQEEGQSGTLPRQDLVLQSSNSYSTGSWLYVRGVIQNMGNTDAKLVKAVVTLYNQYDVIIGAMSTYTDPNAIPAGGSAPFTVSTEYWPNFDHFTVQIQGQ
jgi:hypothetical protein